MIAQILFATIYFKYVDEIDISDFTETYSCKGTFDEDFAVCSTFSKPLTCRVWWHTELGIHLEEDSENAKMLHMILYISFHGNFPPFF